MDIVKIRSISMLKRKRHIMLPVIALWATGCHYSFEPEEPISLESTYSDFEALTGHKVGHDIYLPNAFTGWDLDSSNTMEYDQERALYKLTNISIEEGPIDDWGPRFKITTQYWEHQLGFVPMGSTSELSTFGVQPEGTVLLIERFPDTNDMYFEVPPEAQTNYLHIFMKFISRTPEQAVIYVHYTENPIGL